MSEVGALFLVIAKSVLACQPRALSCWQMAMLSARRSAASMPRAAPSTSISAPPRFICRTSTTEASPKPANGPAQHKLAPATVGRIELIVGPMFAGKSTELLFRVRHERSAGRKVAVLKSDRDTRYGAFYHVQTHGGDKIECFAAGSLCAFRDGEGAEAYAAADVIAIDEAQFFGDLFEFVADASDLHHKTVLVAGLDGDFKRQRFGQILDLVPLADCVTKLGSACHFCSRTALFSMRVVADDRQELVGGADKYRPACRFHYMQHHKQ